MYSSRCDERSWDRVCVLNESVVLRYDLREKAACRCVSGVVEGGSEQQQTGIRGVGLRVLSALLIVLSRVPIASVSRLQPHFISRAYTYIPTYTVNSKYLR